MREVVLAVDIGGTKTVVALADRGDVLLDTASAPTPALFGPDAVVRTVVDLAAELLARSPGVRALGAGIGTAGVVDVGAGSIVSATDTFTDWAGTPLAALLRTGLVGLLATPGIVHVQNDVDAHAAGEYLHGAASGADSALVVTVGTGVGAGIILGGRPLRGARHVAGEIAHVPTPGAGHLRCPCGRFGHLEALGSGVGMYRHYLSLGGEPVVIDARGIAERAHAGDPVACRAVEDSAAAVGRAIASAVTILDPERVVITGGVARIGDLWWDAVRRSFHAEVIDVLQQVPLVPGRLGDDAPLRGAAASAWDVIEGRP
ncbi:ROK family protein [Cryobacterium sp. N19]|uniref:ROK family protein n=1 Tax=Cryobacterium sp. N19 TaxID=2048288 RepID=UPI0018ED0094|nr:ROK family protein [Cryobacterium sp. N19]